MSASAAQKLSVAYPIMNPAAKVRRFPETAKRALAFIEAGVLCSWRRIARKPRCTGRFARAKNFRFVVGSLENDGAKCAARDFVTY